MNILKKIIKSKTLKSTLCSAALIGALSSSSLANAESVASVGNSTFKARGFTQFQTGYRNQSKLGTEKNVSANRKDLAFFNNAAFNADFEQEYNNMKYGMRVVVAPSAQKKNGASYNGTHLFIENDNYGRFEAGSPHGAGYKMSVGGGNITAGAGDYDRYADFEPEGIKTNCLAPTFVSFTEFFLDHRLVSSIDDRKFSAEPGRRISYYTPKFGLTDSTKVQAGVSYTLDSSNTGAQSQTKNSVPAEIKQISANKGDKFVFDLTLKDAFSAGISVEQNLAEGFDLLVGVNGEYGKAAGSAKKFAAKTSNLDESEKNPTDIFKLKDLKDINVGAVLSYGSFSIAGSYGTLGDSLTTKEYHKTGTNTNYITGAIAYNQGPIKVSLGYFRSDRFKNIVDAYTLATDYKLAPGLTTFAEVSHFQLNGRPEFFPDAPKKKSDGIVAILGAKLSL